MCARLIATQSAGSRARRGLGRRRVRTFPSPLLAGGVWCACHKAASDAWRGSSDGFGVARRTEVGPVATGVRARRLDSSRADWELQLGGDGPPRGWSRGRRRQGRRLPAACQMSYGVSSWAPTSMRSPAGSFQRRSYETNGSPPASARIQPRSITDGFTNPLVSVSNTRQRKERKKTDSPRGKGGMGGRHAATTQGF